MGKNFETSTTLKSIFNHFGQSVPNLNKIQQELEVTDSQMTRNEINAIMPQERTNMDLLPAFINDLRVITIGEQQDMCPCAGTHVRNISEIGQLEFTGKKSKGKGKQRVSYILN